MKRAFTTLTLVLGLLLAVTAYGDGYRVWRGSATAVGSTTYTLPQGSSWAEIHVWGASANFTVKLYRRATADSPMVQIGADIVNPDGIGINYGGVAGEQLVVRVSTYVGGTAYWRVLAR